jgi:hypothetical protein
MCVYVGVCILLFFVRCRTPVESATVTVPKYALGSTTDPNLERDQRLVGGAQRQWNVVAERGTVLADS